MALREKMAALETKLQEEKERNERRATEDELLKARWEKLEMLYQAQLKKEAELANERRKLQQEKEDLAQKKDELSRREKQRDEGLKGFALSLVQLGAPKIE